MVIMRFHFRSPVIAILVISTYVLHISLTRDLNFTLVVAFYTFSGSISQSFLPLTKGLLKYFSYFYIPLTLFWGEGKFF